MPADPAGDLVVDASVLGRILFDEVGAIAARDRLASATGLIAPDLIHLEIASVAVKRVTRQLSTADAARAAVAAVGRIIDETTPAAALAARGLDLALTLGLSAYDAAYVALAERCGARLVTADAKLAARCRDGGFGEWVELL